MAPSQYNKGFIVTVSQNPAEAVWGHLMEALEKQGIPPFATIDHAANAQHAGLELPFTRVAIFGSALTGTPLMVKAPDIAIDLPLRIMVRADGSDTVLLYEDPVWLAARHGLEHDDALIQRMAALLKDLTQNAARA